MQHSIIVRALLPQPKLRAEIKSRLNSAPVIRTISYNDRCTSMSLLYKQLNLLKLDELYNFELGRFMHQPTNKNVPDVFYKSLTKRQSNPHLRHQKYQEAQYFLPRVKTKAFRKNNFGSEELNCRKKSTQLQKTCIVYHIKRVA